METPEFAESARKYIEDYFDKIEKYRKKMSSKEYINWIYEYISDNKYADDESALYTYEGINAENRQLLGAFLDYLKEIAIQQRVPVISDDKCVFENEMISIKIRNKYFKISRMYGQGSLTSVDLLDKESGYTYVKL